MLDQALIRSIASWGGEGAITSFYLDVDGRRYPRWSDVEPRVDHLFRAARHHWQLAAPGTEDVGEADLAAIRDWLDGHPDRKATRGVALFSCASKDLFEAVDLPVPVQDQVVVDRDADVAQLCMVLSASWAAIAVAVDRQRWRVVRLDPDGHAYELDVLDDVVPRSIDVDIELAGFDRHRAELAREHYRSAARFLEAELSRRSATYLVLCGPQESLAQLEAYLPRHVASRVAGRTPLRLEVGTSEVARAAREVIERTDQEHRSDVIGALSQRVGTGTRAVGGLDATLGALGDQLVATLAVERTLAAPGGRCDDCRLLAARSGSCRRCGARVSPIENVVDAAIADAFLHDLALVPVTDGALRDIGRIGALLSRTVPTASGDLRNA